MEISVDFLDGRIVEYNTTSLVPADPLRGVVKSDGDAKNYVTEYALRLDLLATAGLRLDVYYNTLGDDSSGDRVDMTDELGPVADGRPRLVAAATRRIRGVIYLLSSQELESASYILVRRCGEAVAVAWRQGSGNWLIDGMRFARMARQVYSDAQITSKNAQEAIMMNYLNNAMPTLSEEELAALTGYPLEAWEEIQEMEMANVGGGIPEPDVDDVPDAADASAGPDMDPSEDDAEDTIVPDGVDFDEEDE